MKYQVNGKIKIPAIILLALGVIIFASCSIQKDMNGDQTVQDSTDMTKASAQNCDQYGTILINGGQYIVQNNVWGASTAQCITVPDTTRAAFTVSTSAHNQGSVAAYPSIYLGDHWGVKTTGWTSVQVSRISTATYSWSVNGGISGTYNIAAEAWLSPNTTGSGGYSGGAELMIWLNAQGMQPAGSQIGTYGSFQVWYANMGWNYVCYYQTGKTSGSFNLKDFIADAQSRGYIQSSWYLHDIEAGFEIMSGGQGLAVNSFSATITGGATSSTASSRSSAVSSSRSSAQSSAASSRSSAASSSGGGTYAVNYTVNNDWGTGATCTVTMKNNSGSAVNGWTLVWTFAGSQKITQIWNATQTQSGATVTAKNLSYNGTIGANGGTQGFGFNLSYTGSNAKPTAFTLNGTACTLY